MAAGRQGPAEARAGASGRRKLERRIEPPSPLVGSTSGADPFGLDLAFRERVLPIFRLLYERYWRVEARGVGNVPAEGPVILVANHSGAIPFDGAMIATALAVAHPNARVLRFLYDGFVENLGPVASFYRRVGGARASFASALQLLELGHAVLIFPEGIAGPAKPFTERYRVRGFRSGFARLALALHVPVVPVAVVGAEEIYPLVGKIEALGKLLGAPYLPLTPFFPALGLLGALPLPSKWLIQFGRPIVAWQPARDGDAMPRHDPAELSALVRRRVMRAVRRLRRRRQSIFFG